MLIQYTGGMRVHQSSNLLSVEPMDLDKPKPFDSCSMNINVLHAHHLQNLSFLHEAMETYIEATAHTLHQTLY